MENIGNHGFVAAVAALCAFAAQAVEIRVQDEKWGIDIAQQRARGLKAANPEEPVTVVLPKGEWRIASPISITAQDSGTPASPMVWRAEKGAVVMGGMRLGPWRDEGDGTVSTDIPKDARGECLAIDMLFVNDRRASRSVLPKNRGNFAIPGTELDSWTEDVRTNAEGRVVHAKEFTRMGPEAAAVLDRVPAEEIADVQFQLRNEWMMARRRVAGWDSAKKLLFTEAFGGKVRRGCFGWGGGSMVRFENLREGFVDPGDWLYDRRAGKIRYRLRAGESAATLVADAPVNRLTELLKMSGVRDFRLEGFEFLYSDATQGEGDDPAKANQSYQMQSAAGYDSAISLERCERVTLADCRVAHTGNYAFRIGDGCRQVTLDRCRAEDLGAGAVRIGSRKPPTVPGGISRRILRELGPDSCAFVTVKDCTFREGGRFNTEGTAVHLSHASDCTIEHNLIDDFYYTGVSVGFIWGYAGSVSQRNLVRGNRISRIGQREQFDLAGIYCLGTSHGTRIVGNWISDVGGQGIYMDEGAEGITVENNLCENLDEAGAFMHYGADCVFRNNVFYHGGRRSGRPLAWASRNEFSNVPSSFHLVGNVFVAKDEPLVGIRTLGVRGIFAHNVWWKESGLKEDDFDRLSAADFFRMKPCCGDVVADPLFVDAAHGDFTLKPDSPALKLGFRPFDWKATGPRRSR